MIAALLLLSSVSVDTVAQDVAGPKIDRAWARATPGSATVGAAYFRIESPTDDRLIGLSSPVARKAELHSHIEQNGMMQMLAVDGGLPVAAHHKLELKPGGPFHVMLIDLTTKLKAGDHFPLTIRFEKSGSHDVTVQVLPLGSVGLGGNTDMNDTRKHTAINHDRSSSGPTPDDGQAPAGGFGS